MSTCQVFQYFCLLSTLSSKKPKQCKYLLTRCMGIRRKRTCVSFDRWSCFFIYWNRTICRYGFDGDRRRQTATQRSGPATANADRRGETTRSARARHPDDGVGRSEGLRGAPNSSATTCSSSNSRMRWELSGGRNRLTDVEFPPPSRSGPARVLRRLVDAGRKAAEPRQCRQRETGQMSAAAVGGKHCTRDDYEKVDRTTEWKAKNYGDVYVDRPRETNADGDRRRPRTAHGAATHIAAGNRPRANNSTSKSIMSYWYIGLFSHRHRSDSMRIDYIRRTETAASCTHASADGVHSKKD
jgi:hypothetical protein